MASSDHTTAAAPPPRDHEVPPFATFTAADGTPIRLRLTPSGAIELQVGGREPRTLDRFQIAALRVAVLAAERRHKARSGAA